MSWDLQGAALKRAKAAMHQRSIERADADAEELRQQAARDLANSAARRSYLDGLAKQRADQQKAADAAIDREIEPQKQMLKRQWLADHPGKSESDFERSAWPLLRENLVAERDENIRQATLAATRRDLEALSL